MTPELESRLTSVLDYLGTVAQSGTEFVADQAPIVAREIIQWGIWSNAIPLIIVTILVGIFVLNLKRLLTMVYDGTSAEETTAMVIFIFIGGPLVICVVAVLCNCLPDLIKALVSPRLYLLEWVRHITTGK